MAGTAGSQVLPRCDCRCPARDLSLGDGRCPRVTDPLGGCRDSGLAEAGASHGPPAGPALQALPPQLRPPPNSAPPTHPWQLPGSASRNLTPKRGCSILLTGRWAEFALFASVSAAGLAPSLGVRLVLGLGPSWCPSRDQLWAVSDTRPHLPTSTNPLDGNHRHPPLPKASSALGPTPLAGGTGWNEWPGPPPGTGWEGGGESPGRRGHWLPWAGAPGARSGQGLGDSLPSPAPRHPQP